MALPDSIPTIPDHTLVRCIGAGAYGEVWLGRSVLGALRAIKVVYRKSFREERGYEREFRGIHQFEPISRTNDGLLDILQVGRNDQAGYYYYVMELADSAGSQGGCPTDEGQAGQKSSSVNAILPGDETLVSYVPRTLQLEVQRRGCLPPAECVNLALSLTLALGYLHRNGLIHRDIKPANIIFVDGMPKLADLGLVASYDDTCSFVGTEGFIAPEGPISPRSDLFSFGKVLYEISTGKDRKDFPEPPTGLGEDPGSEDLTELNAVVLKACALDPEERYQSAEELHADLALLHSGKSVKWKRLVEKRLSFARKAGAMVTMVAALAISGYLYQRHQTGEAKRFQRQAEELVARMQIQSAENLFARGDSSMALAHLAFVLRHNPNNRVAAERIMAALEGRKFPRLAAQPLVHPDKLALARFSPDGTTVVSVTVGNRVYFGDTRTGEIRASTARIMGSINSIDFSPDSSKVIAASSDGTISLLDVRLGNLVVPPFQHEQSVNDAVFSPNGEWIGTASDDAKVRRFDARKGALIGLPFPHEAAVKALAISPNNQWLASATAAGSLRIWEVESNRVHQHFHLNGPVRLIRFSPDSKRLAAAVDHEKGPWQVQVWEVESGKPVTRPLVHSNRIFGLAFSPDGQLLAVPGTDQFAHVWQLATGLESFRAGHAAIVRSATFSPDGRYLLTASVDHTARLWDVATGDPFSEPMRHEGRIIHAEFSQDGKGVLTASWDKTVKIWHLPGQQMVKRTLPHGAWVISAEWDASGRQLLALTGPTVFTATRNNSWGFSHRATATLWTGKSLSQKSEFPLPPKAGIVTAQFTRAGARALISKQEITEQTAMRADYEYDSEAYVWDVDSGQTVGDVMRLAHDVNCADFSLDGSKVATGTTRGAIQIWDAEKGTATTPLLAQDGWIYAVKFSRDGGKLASVSGAGSAMVWDVKTGRRVAGPLRHGAEVWSAQFSPDARKLVTTCLDNNARIWSIAGDLISELRHGGPVEYAEFSPNGAKVVTASGDGTVHLWNAETGKQLTEPLQHADLVTSARFSPDGLRVISASRDGTAQIWDVATGLRLGEPLRHLKWVVSARFSADGRKAVTASLDQTVGIWDVPVTTTPPPRWLAGLSEAVAGVRLNADRIPEPLPWLEYQNLKTRLLKMEIGSGSSGEYLKQFFSKMNE